MPEGFGMDARFDRSGFVRLIEAQGEPVRWWNRSRCACYQPLTTSVDTTHPLCHGTGWRFTERTPFGAKAVLSGPRASVRHLPAGELVDAQLSCLCLTEVLPLQTHDLILTESRWLRLDRRLRRGKGDSDLFPWPEVLALVAVEDRNQTYTDEVSLGAPNRIGWHSGTGPEAGSRYVVLARVPCVWEVLLSGQHPRRQIGEAFLPSSFYLKPYLWDSLHGWEA